MLGTSFNSDTYFYIAYTFLILIIINLLLLSKQPQSQVDLPFKAPFIPWLPMLAVTINIYLIMNLTIQTWVRFVVWMLFGLIIYFTYGINNSTGFVFREACDLK